MIPGIVAGQSTPQSGGGAREALYWRLNITSTHGDRSSTELRELQFRGAVGGANMATDTARAAASSEYSAEYGAGKAFDNNAGTIWLSTSMPAWIRYSFAAPTSVVEYALFTTNGTPYLPDTWTLECSDDAAVWEVVHAVADAVLPLDALTAFTV